MPRRRSKKPPAIIVEDARPAVDDPLANWELLGRKLAAFEPSAFEKLTKLAEGYIALHERPQESREAHEARVRRINGMVTRN